MIYEFLGNLIFRKNQDLLEQLGEHSPNSPAIWGPLSSKSANIKFVLCTRGKKRQPRFLEFLPLLPKNSWQRHLLEKSKPYTLLDFVKENVARSIWSYDGSRWRHIILRYSTTNIAIKWGHSNTPQHMWSQRSAFDYCQLS